MVKKIPSQIASQKTGSTENPSLSISYFGKGADRIKPKILKKLFSKSILNIFIFYITLIFFIIIQIKKSL
jgi:hypothetical protein